jgi:hypothetical protein
MGTPMAKLTNVFSWSHSAAHAFEACRRKRYWSKYGAWGGWERDASPECRTAYRLNKMTNRFQQYGIAAEDSILWMLKQVQAGADPTPEQAYNTVARPLLRQIWDESKNGVWKRVPKAGCLHEHYYPEFCSLEDRELMHAMADVVKVCIRNFHETVLPRLAHVTPDMEIPISVVGKGDPEHFLFEGVKIYAIPDYVYREGGLLHILDWKAGSVKPEHAEQIALYALWAETRHGIPPDQVRLSLEYLQIPDVKVVPVDAEVLEQVKGRIRESVQDMAQYLEGSDIERNIPLPKAEWDLCYDPDECRFCEFLELCRPELRRDMGDACP